jgi:hypothetical protein
MFLCALPKTLKVEVVPDFCRNIFAATSNRRLTSVAQLRRHIRFFTTDAENREIDHTLRQCFQIRFIRWLNGKGHPVQLRGTIVPEGEYDKHRDNPLIRATVLLQAVADTDLLPVDGSFKLKVGFPVLYWKPWLTFPSLL